MELNLKRVRLAFPNIWEPKPFNGNGEPRCDASFLIDPKAQALIMQAIVNTMTTVANEKWGAKAQDMLKSLRAKGDLCLHDGNTKSEYDGFPGNYYLSASNKSRPAVVGKAKYEGKVVYIDKNGDGFIDGKKIDNYRVKAPYSGCYVNVKLDIWAQENGYGKRINAKLLAIQFEDDGEAFSGGAGFDEADFDYAEDGGASASADDGFGFGADTSAAATGDDGFFGSGAAKEDAPFSFS